MRFRERRHVIDFIFPLAVLFVFAASSFAVLVLSAHIYSSQTETADKNYASLTPLAYVSEKVRQNDAEGGITVQTYNNQDCLALKGTFGDSGYTTYIYEYDGMLKELLIRDGVSATLADGKNIMETNRFKIKEIETGLYRFSCIDEDGKETAVIISGRSTP